MARNSQAQTIVIQGASQISEVPGLDAYADRYEIVCAPDAETLAQVLPGAQIMLGWNFRGKDLKNHWDKASQLEWIHWSGAGVDSVLFDELAASDVVLTNSRGMYDQAIAEFTLAYMLSEAKLFPQSAQLHAQGTWQHRFTTKLAGQKAAIYGVGSIGRQIARILRAVCLEVCGIGRSGRSGDADFGEIYGAGDKLKPLDAVDWVIGILPGTPQTAGYFDKDFFSAMKPTARFINLGRGTAVIENELIAALTNRTIAGAMLDVFANEPLPTADPLWDTPGLVISPHMSGDYHDFQIDVAALFFDNLERFAESRPLKNIVDKKLGFVAAAN